jgi:serine/threonine-protein kinase
MAAFTPGLRLSDRYLLERCVGAGGMSQIWLARDEVLGRPVAVKTLQGARLHDPALIETVHREARAAANISHPHVTQVYDFGEADLPDGGRAVPYLVMELLEGEDLGRRLASGALAWPEAVRVATEVAGALSAAHAMGIVHGDIKPANVMLTSRGAKVVDFGISSWDADPDDAGVRGGTPAFLAPELFGGDPPTPASDMYAFGVLLYSALTGVTPVAASSWEEAARSHAAGVAAAPLQVDGLPVVVADLCARCLAASPGQRPTSEEAASALRAALRSPVPDRPTEPARDISSAAVGAPTMAMAAPASYRFRFPRAARSRWRVPAFIAASAVMVAGLVLIAAAAFAGRPDLGNTTVTAVPPASPPSRTGPEQAVPADPPPKLAEPAPGGHTCPPQLNVWGHGKGNDKSGRGNGDDDNSRRGKGRDDVTRACG